MKLRKPEFCMFQTVVDKLSGFTGSIMLITYYFNGAIHYGVGPRSLDEKGGVREWEFFDETRLRLDDEQIPLDMKIPTFKHRFDIYDVVKNMVSKFEGTVMGISDYSTGCTQYGLVMKDNKDLASDKLVWHDENVLQFMTKLEIPEKKTKPTSGPDFNMRQK